MALEPVCATGCDTAALPVVKFDDCAPETHASEIQTIYLGTGDTEAFTDWTTVTEWTSRISQTATTANTLRPITVIGDKPVPTANSKTISLGRKINTNKTHVINVTIDETPQENHELMRSLECGGTFKMWYATAGGLLFGGNEGITVSFDVNMKLDRGTDGLMTLEGVITWDSKFTEERTENPIA